LIYLVIHCHTIQSNKKENKSEQALQIITGHVLAKSYPKKDVQCMGVDSLWSQTPLYNKPYLMNFIFILLLLLSDNGEK
jgi:hypothetical protein